jgi:hypothetical protein
MPGLARAGVLGCRTDESQVRSGCDFQRLGLFGAAVILWSGWFRSGCDFQKIPFRSGCDFGAPVISVGVAVTTFGAAVTSLGASVTFVGVAVILFGVAVILFAESSMGTVLFLQ